MWSSGWVDGWLCQKIMPLSALSCKIRLARFSAGLKIQDRAECGNNVTVHRPLSYTNKFPPPKMYNWPNATVVYVKLFLAMALIKTGKTKI